LPIALFTTLRQRWLMPCLVALALAHPGGPATGQTLSTTAPAQTRAQGATASTAPEWAALSVAQQAALAPLAPIWRDINTNRKRKWIALSANFDKLSATEQATLHLRMGDWARLSTVERNRARLNFAESSSLSSEDKKAHWEAYQALSPAQKQQLAKQAANRPTIGAAPALTDRRAGKLAAVPVTRSNARDAIGPLPAASAAATIHP
jgi:hypothetical protein